MWEEGKRWPSRASFPTGLSGMGRSRRFAAWPALLTAKFGITIMKLEQTAIHESGHVVVGYVLGLACHEVVLTHHKVKKTGAYGYVISPNHKFGYQAESPRELQRILRDGCIASCAGLAAEHVFFDVPLSIDNENAQCDFENIIQCERDGLKIRGKRQGFVGDDATMGYILRQLKNAEKLVIRHRDVIQRLAEVLVERKRLSEKDVQRLLKKWIPSSFSG